MLTVIGCAKKYEVQPTEEPVKASEEKKERLKEVSEEKILQKPAEIQREIAEEELSGKGQKPKESAIQSKESAAQVKTEFVFKDILFDFDKYDIKEDARPALDSAATWLKNNKGVKIIIEGHCDERGTNEYNLALGEKRANAARDYLTASGIASEKIKTISYGEEKPICAEQTEDCFQKNRRANFAVGK
ncbi:MAG: peptidoglycan-associated lipoprotein Pal [Nitrospirae bacterium]|nr:peptidoglycan-associated lipoprotein Pal [Nitrospirota bacterium]